MKPKDMVPTPWMVAMALQADGWYLRSDIIWSKPNPMPESVTDRPTKSHEYLFLLSKSAKYFWDADAVRESVSPLTVEVHSRYRDEGSSAGVKYDRDSAFFKNGKGRDLSGRNIRSVWTIATAPYPGAHFATFPPKLVEPCIKAGCPDKACGECGAPWERVVELRHDTASPKSDSDFYGDGRDPGVHRKLGSAYQRKLDANPPQTLGFRPTCIHDAPTVPGVVLDPFAGTGTVGLVAQRLSRRAVLIDLNAEYLAQCLARNAQTPMGLVS